MKRTNPNQPRKPSILTRDHLSFKVETTDGALTGKTGLALVFEAALKLNVVRSIFAGLPQRGSNRGFHPFEFVMSLVLMFCGGGRTPEDIRVIAADSALRRLCGRLRVPTADAIRHWIRRLTNLVGLKRVNEELVQTILVRRPETDYTLDSDATLIPTEKACATPTYEKFRGVSALVSYLAELALVVRCDYRTGKVVAWYKLDDHIRYVDRLLRRAGKRLKYFRSDSAAYMAKTFNLLEKKGVIFTITADQDSAVKEAITAIPANQWQRLYQDGIFTEREWATTIHVMNDTLKPFRLIVQRWWTKPQQPELFPEGYRYYAIATNDNQRTGPEIIEFHNQRGNSENYHKELKSGFGMEYVPSKELAANAVYFELGVLAYNLTIALKRLYLGGEWVTRTISSLRWELLNLAGKVVTTGGQLLVRMNRREATLFETVRGKLLSAVASG
jgi:hypothetical protein